ncbi:MAG: hypothetical protein RLZZ15_4550 [Verrucomicrobiota bacterium]|jgi:Cys-tRNA synthase (O-phospho-L-seryl-tRNA:Cys-tRNA synthase)
MAVTSPHQPTSLSDRITEMKEDRASKIALRQQIETLGQTTSGAGLSTTFVSYSDLCERISQLTAQIDALTAQLNGDEVPTPGLILQQYRSGYN